MRDELPIKVLHLVRGLQVGGLEKLVLEMCRHAQGRADVRMAVCGLVPGDGLAEVDRYAGVRTLALPRSYEKARLGAFEDLVRLLRAQRPDVLHTHNFVAQLHGAPAARLAAVPVNVCTKHGREMVKLWGRLGAAGMVWRMADLIVPVSEDVRRRMMDAYRIDPDKLRIILNGIDTDAYRPLSGPRGEARLRLLGCDGPLLIGSVCRMVVYKGIDTLLGAFAAVRREEPEARLVLVGDGPDLGRFQAHARALGLGESVRFLGSRNDVRDIYPLLDVLVLASYQEGIPLTPLEAAACGVPVVATAVGGLPQVLDDGAAGLLAPPKDAGALARAIMSLHRQPDLAARLAAAGRRRVEEVFSLERMTSDYVALYHELYSRKIGLPQGRRAVGSSKP
jgi:glycosyltransferase involved in cell wall biosynthesis